MGCVYLVHWNAREGAARASLLREAGFDVRFRPIVGPGFLRDIRASLPDAIVIDLTRLPSYGRDVGVALRAQKATRSLPLVFVDGEPEKVARIRSLLPDATFCRWRGVRGALKRAASGPRREQAATASVFDAYAGRPLAAKLGIKTGTVLGLLGAPPGFETTLGELPGGVRVQRNALAGTTLAVWFVGSRQTLEDRLPALAARHGDVPIWIAWRKAAARPGGDVTQPIVRAAGLSHGLVDCKVCSIDSTWSGLLFRRRKRQGRPAD